MGGMTRGNLGAARGAQRRSAEHRLTRKYQALLAPLPGAGDRPLAPARWPGTWQGVVRAVDHATRATRFLTALITTPDDTEPPAGPYVTVTMVVVGPDGILDVGDGFTLWRGGDLAHGVVTRRLFV